MDATAAIVIFVIGLIIFLVLRSVKPESKTDDQLRMLHQLSMKAGNYGDKDRENIEAEMRKRGLTSHSPESIITEHPDGGRVIDTSNVANLVKEWNKLHESYQKMQENRDWMRVEEETRLSEIMREIEVSCVAVHMTSPPMRSITKPSDLERVIQPFAGKDLRNDLNIYDDIALVSLKSRISTLIPSDDNRVSDIIWDKCGDYIDTLPKEDSDCIKLFLSKQSIPFISAFYEIAVTNVLGNPYNVYVAQNIRELFIMAIRHSFSQNHNIEIERKSAETLIRNYCSGLRDSVKEYFSGNPGGLVKVLYFSGINECNEITEDFCHEIDQSFSANNGDRFI